MISRWNRAQALLRTDARQPTPGRVDVAVFCMPLRGHFNRLTSIIGGLSRVGARVDVYTHRDFQAEVYRCGARFHDLFAEVAVEDLDATSIPTASRFVSFAGAHASRLVHVLERARPRMIVYDSFAIIGWVVARLLDVPSVCICAGHNRLGQHAVAERMRTGPVRISKACEEAVGRLHHLGLTDIDAFSYLDCASRHLNVYCEPPHFLKPSERAPFEPLVFYGSLDPGVASHRALDGHAAWRRARSRRSRIYVSFGTVVWTIRANAARRALWTLCDVLGQLGTCDVLISLGGTPNAPFGTFGLPDNVQVEDYVDQWSVLSETDLFVTHQGLNSTHEAIFHRVPMVAHPFFGDQPALAQRCEELSLSVRMMDLSKEVSDAREVRSFLTAALDESRSDESRMCRDTARQWEVEVMNQRPIVLEQILQVAM